ncbi:hypothetical protein PR048_005499 [Dryococelus australis]|uniref:PiggyBac transposable element-derived protein domain-containing protein n=1 Tax=Dryococelus australis TaxID=614101 RepID=A0ABQ9I8D0_9NEOP|nr:hypothetical protein PR048_005499 [Dryococelus australis]
MDGKRCSRRLTAGFVVPEDSDDSDLDDINADPDYLPDTSAQQRQTLSSISGFHFVQKKYYHRMFFLFIDVALVNGWYRRHCDGQNISHKDQLELLGFRCDVVSALCKEGKHEERKRGRPSSDSLERQLEMII